MADNSKYEDGAVYRVMMANTHGFEPVTDAMTWADAWDWVIRERQMFGEERLECPLVVRKAQRYICKHCGVTILAGMEPVVEIECTPCQSTRQ
jgi:hypothetical protein